jgi:hypothetical protein
MLDLTKKYRTRDGQKVEKVELGSYRVTLDDGVQYDVHLDGKWRRDGKDCLDLIPISNARIAACWKDGSCYSFTNHSRERECDFGNRDDYFDRRVEEMRADGWKVLVTEVEEPND